jgi:hypothetical protein
MRLVYLEGGGHDLAAPQQPPHVLAIGDLAASRLTAHRVLPTVQSNMDEYGTVNIEHCGQRTGDRGQDS